MEKTPNKNFPPDTSFTLSTYITPIKKESKIDKYLINKNNNNENDLKNNENNYEEKKSCFVPFEGKNNFDIKKNLQNQFDNNSLKFFNSKDSKILNEKIFFEGKEIIISKSSQSNISNNSKKKENVPSQNTLINELDKKMFISQKNNFEKKKKYFNNNHNNINDDFIKSISFENKNSNLKKFKLFDEDLVGLNSNFNQLLFENNSIYNFSDSSDNEQIEISTKNSLEEIKKSIEMIKKDNFFNLVNNSKYL